MGTLKKIAVLFLFFCLVQKATAQCNAATVPSPSVTPGFDCSTSTSFLAYIVQGGGTAPYTYTVITTGNVTVTTGMAPTATGTITSLSAGTYTVLFTDVNGCVGSQVLTAAPPYSSTNTTFLTSSVTCNGGNNGTSIATPPTSFSGVISYTWAPGTSTSATLSNVPAGVYTVTISDTKGCVQSSTVALLQPPPIQSTLSNTFVNCYGSFLNSPITSTNNVGATSYTVNGSALSSSTANNLTAGTQTILTKDSKGCVQTNTVYIDQRQQALISFTPTKPNCPRSKDGSVAVSVSNDQGPYSYTWEPGNSTNPTLQNIPTGSYTVGVLDGNNCITTSVIAVAPSASATVSFSTAPEHCSAADGAFTLSVAGVGPPYTYTTIPGGVSGSTGANLSSGNYTTIINYNTVCIDSIPFFIGDLSPVSIAIQNSVAIDCYNACTGSIQLNVQNAVNPVTYSATGTPTTNSPLISGLCSGFYVITAMDADGCPATTTVNFTNPPVFSYSATAPTETCSGQYITLQGSASGGTGNYAFVWNPGNITGQAVSLIPGGTTVYDLNAYDSNGCTLSPVQVTVIVLPPISVNINSSNAGICPGTTAQITPTISGGDGNYSYQWLPGNINNPSIFVENVTVPTYTFIVTDGCGSPPAVKLIPINLFPATKPSYSTLNNKGCEPLCAVFINTTPKSESATWNYGDSPFEETGNTTQYCYQKAGKYTLWMSIIDSNNCRASLAYTNAIEVLKSPIADFLSNPAVITLKDAANVLIKNTTNYGVSYHWFFEGKDLGSSQDISYTFQDTGCYLFELIATGGNGCTDTAQKYLCVSDGFNFYMPDSFTPDNNNLNDVFIPKGTGWLTDGYEFEIFDRWGLRVFKTNDVLKGWDGSNGGAKTPQGSYIWRVALTDTQNSQHALQGLVTLLH